MGGSTGNVRWVRPSENKTKKYYSSHTLQDGEVVFYLVTYHSAAAFWFTELWENLKEARALCTQRDGYVLLFLKNGIYRGDIINKII